MERYPRLVCYTEVSLYSVTQLSPLQAYTSDVSHKTYDGLEMVTYHASNRRKINRKHLLSPFEINIYSQAVIAARRTRGFDASSSRMPKTCFVNIVRYTLPTLHSAKATIKIVIKTVCSSVIF